LKLGTATSAERAGEYVWREDEAGVPRLVAAPGDPIPA
jgi:hypothetical protein